MPKMTKAQRRRHRQQLARQRAAAAPSAAPPPVRARPVAARRARRGVVRGWSASGLSRFCDWLRSVDLARLDDSAVHFTLAFEDCPPPPVVARLLSALGDSLRKARRRPASRYLLWLEFRSGYPVVSGLAFCACPATDLAADVCGHCDRLAAASDCHHRSQAVIVQTLAADWVAMVRRFSAFSVADSALLVPDWWNSCPRVWRVGGDWPRLPA